MWAWGKNLQSFSHHAGFAPFTFLMHLKLTAQIQTHKIFHDFHDASPGGVLPVVFLVDLYGFVLKYPIFLHFHHFLIHI